MNHRFPLGGMIRKGANVVAVIEGSAQKATKNFQGYPRRDVTFKIQTKEMDPIPVQRVFHVVFGVVPRGVKGQICSTFTQVNF